MRVKDLPNGIRQLAESLVDEKYIDDECGNYKETNKLNLAFDWDDSPQKQYFWIEIYDGNFQPFYDLYGKEPNDRWYWMEQQEPVKDYNYLIELFNEWDNEHISLTYYKDEVCHIHDIKERLFIGSLQSTISWIEEQLNPKEPIKLNITDTELIEMINNWSMTEITINDVYNKFKNVKPI